MKMFNVVAACAAACSWSCAGNAAMVYVKNARQLDAALESAKGGDIIRVAPGNYGSLAIMRQDYARAVTIIAANSARPPVFTHLDVKASSNLIIARLIVKSPAPQGAILNAVDVWNSRNVRMSDMVFRGVSGGGVSNEARGIRVSGSSNITVAKSSFTELSNGITTDRSTRLTIVDNAFNGIRVNGVITDGATNSTIMRNRFSQFRPEGEDHPDAIQVYATDYATSSLRIADNLILGDARGQMQGIFISNNVGDRALLDRITISDNLLWGTMWNGIYAAEANRITVSGNRLYSNIDIEVPKTWVRLEDVASATVTANYAGKYIYADLDQLNESANLLGLSDAKALAEVAVWDSTHVAATRLLAYRSVTGIRPVQHASLSSSRSSFMSAAGTVPEPASWASLIFGFMVTGLARRRLQPGRVAPIQGA